MKKKYMAKLSLFVATGLFLLQFVRVDVSALSPSEIVSETAILMDAETGQVLFDQDIHKKMYPASITKIMTAILALENCKPDEIITVSENAVNYDPDVAYIALCEGEQITIDQALYALMLPSANDVANAIAEHVAGSQDAFAELMNGKAVMIGAHNTHFANAHGLHDKEHYTTAYDMALITRYAMNVPGFMAYYGEAQYAMPSNNQQLEERPFVNGDNMLLPWKGEFDKRVLGGKVGYTNEARHTMSTVAAEDDRTLICVVMYSPYAEYKYSDTKKLLDFGFYSFHPHLIPAESFSSLTVPVGTADNPRSNAFFQYPHNLTLLLPDDLAPDDIEICYNPPPVFSQEEDATCSILLVLKEHEDGLPPILMNVSMEKTIMPTPVVMTVAQTVDIMDDESETIIAADTETRSGLEGILRYSWVCEKLLLTIVLGFGLFGVSQYSGAKKNRVPSLCTHKVREWF